MFAQAIAWYSLAHDLAMTQVKYTFIPSENVTICHSGAKTMQLCDNTTLDTPEVAVSLSTLLRNIRTMQNRAAAAGLELWPHVKTHKSLFIAQIQLREGARGLTASKVDEALVFINAGLGPLLLAYPVVNPKKAGALCAAASAKGISLRCMVDSVHGLQTLKKAASEHGLVLPVYIKIDVGLHRCGVLPHGEELLELARRVAEARHLRLHGLLSHAGHAYGAQDVQEVRDIAHEERRLMLHARERLLQDGFPDVRLSVGSTPTALGASSYEGLHELRPGNYVFLDRTPLRLGLGEERDIALGVIASVVSKNAMNLIIDAGSKVLGLDKAPHGITPKGGGEYGYGLLRWIDAPHHDAKPSLITRLSEEHGFIPREQAPDFDPPLGARVCIIPNHSCVVANLAERLAVLRPDAQPEYWPVDARGRVR